MGYSSISKAYRMYKKRTKKVMESVNVVIDEASDSSFEKISEEIPKAILPSEPKDVQREVDQELVSPSTPSVVEVTADIPTSPESESHEAKGPSSRIKLNHPPEVIVGNMNELTIRKRTVDKCVTNFVSYSCYLSQIDLPRLRMLCKMKVGLRPCMMNCSSFKGTVSGPYYLDQKESTSLAQSGYFVIKLMMREM